MKFEDVTYRPPPWVHAVRFRLLGYVVFLIGLVPFFHFVPHDPLWISGTIMFTTVALSSGLSRAGHYLKGFGKCPSCGKIYNIDPDNKLYYRGVLLETDTRPDRSICRHCGYKWLEHRKKVLSEDTASVFPHLPDVLNEKYQHLNGVWLAAYAVPAIVGAYWIGWIGLFGITLAVAGLMCVVAWIWGTADAINQIDRDLDHDID